MRSDTNKQKIATDSDIKVFAETASKKGHALALKSYAADDIMLYRDNHFPFIGKTGAILQAETEVGNFKLDDGGIVVTTIDMAYFVKGYTFVKQNKSTEKGNAVQTWKFRRGHWKIVLDILLPVPAK